MEEKAKVQTKKKGPKMVVLIIVGIILIMLLGMQVFASVNGYGNIFFMIKNLVTTGTVTGEEEIFLDKEITLSYQSIDIADGVKVQINKLEIRENESTLCLTIKANEGNKVLPLQYSIKSEGLSETDVKGENISNTYGEFEERLTVNYKFSDDELMILYIKDKDGNLLREIEINLNSHEIFVKGESDTEKISQIELKKYLNVFSELNNGSNLNTNLIKIAGNIWEDILEYRDAYTRDDTNTIIKEFYGDKATFEKSKDSNGKEVEVLKLESNSGYEYDEVTNCYREIADFSDYRNGICLQISDINYENGIYTVKYIYTLATGYEIDDEKIEELPQYEATIKLKRNEDAKYSKYQIVELSKGKEVKEKVAIDINENSTIIDEDVKKIAQKYYDLLGAHAGSPDGLLKKLGYEDSKIYLKNPNIIQENINYYETKIDYAEFKAKILEVISEYCYKEKFDRNYKEYNGKVYYSDGGATGIEYVVKSVKNIGVNKYDVTVGWTNLDNSKEEMVNILILVENNGKYVVDRDNQASGFESFLESHEHSYEVVKNSGTKAEDGTHTTLDGEHDLKCSICGDISRKEGHNFGKWFELKDSSGEIYAYTLWCEACKDYVYTNDYSVVQNSGYELTESDEKEFKTTCTLINKEFKANEKYEVYYFTPNGVYKTAKTTCNENKKINFEVEGVYGEYRIGTVIKADNRAQIEIPNRFCIINKDGINNIDYDFSVDIKDKNLVSGNTYSIHYFDPLSNYKSIFGAECKEDGKVTVDINGMSGNYVVTAITDNSNNDSEQIMNEKYRFEVDSFGNAQ